jgi:tetratricopeptide (TPR) repeat protein
MAGGVSWIMRVNTFFTVLTVLSLAVAGCGGSQLKEMQQQVDQQKTQIESQQRELEELRVQQQQQAVDTTLPPPGSCDDSVMREALRHGDEQYARGKYEIALGYYEDAGKACPGKAQVELSLARVYEAIGNRAEARRHYQLALDAAEANSPVGDQARQGMTRTGSGQ